MKNDHRITEEMILESAAAALADFVPDTETMETDKEYEEEYVSIDDIARENGFWIDEDGHWQELDDEDDWF